MRISAAFTLLFALMLGFTALLAETRTPPPKIVFAARNGDVVFDHNAHAKREKDNCKGCHSTLFAEDGKFSTAGFKPPHKVAEDKKASCGSCHRAGGSAFETKANCANSKCHVKAGAKQG